MNENSADRNASALLGMVSLRLAVGLLGERDNAGWWTSGFLSPTSTAFLVPVFGGNVLQARYQGVLEAAKRVHDERIGVGHVFHLFRLPESMEQRLFEAVQSGGSDLAKTISSSDSAKATLESFANKATAARPGPALMASSETFDSTAWVSEAASLYSAAFGAGLQCFPYIAGAR
ncbi:BrxE family protein [Rhodoblastus sp. 17X3]|uniref:BrxE family protein n=1 Tax=Rhodoblastus sp. 17X3 TaxID=3047026 RepID=UPI0024B70A66|nr:BrxE family protein [Rhodoblastus sp. 17X3]MDI9846721.1 BrxE family protein [Rhodoblastus sp. 17X3]